MVNTVIEPTSISLRFTVVKFRNLTRNVRVARFLGRVSLALGRKMRYLITRLCLVSRSESCNGTSDF